MKLPVVKARKILRQLKKEKEEQSLVRVKKYEKMGIN